MLFKTSTVFSENLAQFPSIDSLQRIEFYQDGHLLSTVDNIEGQKGSLALYFYLFKTMGVLDLSAARRGLELFAEKAGEARAAVGQHPNIDRLLLVESTNKQMEMKVIYKEGENPVNTWEDDSEEQ